MCAQEIVAGSVHASHDPFPLKWGFKVGKGRKLKEHADDTEVIFQGIHKS